MFLEFSIGVKVFVIVLIQTQSLETPPAFRVASLHSEATRNAGASQDSVLDCSKS